MHHISFKETTLHEYTIGITQPAVNWAPSYSVYRRLLTVQQLSLIERGPATWIHNLCKGAPPPGAPFAHSILDTS